MITTIIILAGAFTAAAGLNYVAVNNDDSFDGELFDN